MPTSKPSFWSRPIAPVLLGIGACAACCAAPIGAIVLGAGVAGGLAAVFEPLAGVLLAAAVLLGAAVIWRRRRASAAAPAASCGITGACAIDRSCGCGPSPVARARDVGCTLDESEMPTRLDAFGDLFRRGLKRRTSSDGRVEWIFDWSPSLEVEARALASAEQGCCSFFTFDIRRHGNELHWIASAPPAKQDAIALIDGIAAASIVSSSPPA